MNVALRQKRPSYWRFCCAAAWENARWNAAAEKRQMHCGKISSSFSSAEDRLPATKGNAVSLNSFFSKR